MTWDPPPLPQTCSLVPPPIFWQAGAWFRLSCSWKLVEAVLIKFTVADPAVRLGGGQKHEIYAATFGGHLFMPPPPPDPPLIIQRRPRGDCQNEVGLDKCSKWKITLHSHPRIYAFVIMKAKANANSLCVNSHRRILYEFTGSSSGSMAVGWCGIPPLWNR